MRRDGRIAPLIAKKRKKTRGDLNLSFSVFGGTGLTGFEPATSAVTGQCSNQLNYNPFFWHVFHFKGLIRTCQQSCGEKPLPAHHQN